VSAIDVLVTNNPMAAQRFAKVFHVEYKEVAALDIIKIARDMVHLGHKLLTHPVMSGVPPKDSPFKSIVVSNEADKLDFDSVRIIENAMAVYAKIETAGHGLPDNVAKDFMLIDCEMIEIKEG